MIGDAKQDGIEECGAKAKPVDSFKYGEPHDADEDEDHPRKVPLIVGVVVAHPLLLLAGSVLVSVLAGVLSIKYYDLSDPLAGLRLRNDVSAERADAWYQALFQLRPDSGDEDNTWAPERSVEQNSLHIMYLADEGADGSSDFAGNVFTVEKVQQMRALEDALLNVIGYDEFCLVDLDNNRCADILSPVRYLGNASSQKEIDEGLRAMWEDREADKDATLLHFCKEFDVDSALECTLTQTVIRFGAPLAGYLNAADSEEDQSTILTNWLWDRDGADASGSVFGLLAEARGSDLSIGESQKIAVTFYQSGVFQRESQEILNADALYVGASIVIVLSIMIVHLKSVSLGLMAITQVLMSFPLCFFIYRVIFGIQLFNALSIASVYLLLGIATDDIFICGDALRQSHCALQGAGWTLEKRLGWAFKRSFYTMATTTLTTTLAFASLSLSAIPAIQYFGIWTVILLLTNFFLVCTAFMSSLALVEMYYYKEPTRTKADPEDGPASLEEQRPEESNHPAKGTTPSHFEVFCRDYLAQKVILVKRGRTAIFMAFGTLVLGSLYSATQLELAKEALLAFPKDHPLGVYLTHRGAEGFKVTEESVETVKMVWGLEKAPIDRTDTSIADTLDFGEPQYDPAFEIADEDAQEYLHDICEQVLANRSAALYLQENTAMGRSSDDDKSSLATCFMVAFAKWRAARGENFPVENLGNEDATGSVIDHGVRVPARVQSDSFAELMLEFLRRPEFGYEFYTSVGFERLANSNMHVNFAVQEFASKISETDAYVTRSRVASAWDSFLATVRREQPASLSSGTYYTDFEYFVWQVTQALFLNTVLSSVAQSLAAAFLITMWACRNWLVALIACANVLLVVVMTAACIKWYGFSLGSIESVVLSLTFGVSIDFSVHMAVAYSDAAFELGYETRGKRVEHALVTLGTSISFGALSTLLATAPLLLATLSFFTQFAWILCAAILFAQLSAMLLLPAVLAAIGPEGDTGMICLPRHLRAARKTRGTFTDDVGTTRAESIVECSDAAVRAGSISFGVGILLVIALFVGMDRLRASQMAALDAAADSGSSGADIESFHMPEFASLDEGVWTEMRPGNASICARGTPYAFFVKRGAPGAPVIVEFEGGGACWSLSTCQTASSTFTDTVETARAAFRRGTKGEEVKAGLGDPDGPYGNATHVYISYCTADLHAGHSVVDYTEGLRIRHNGNVNAGYALDYLRDQIPQPSRVLVTGCSAGSYGSFWHAPRIIKMYQDMREESGVDTQVMQLGDAGMGVVTESFITDSFPRWKVLEAGAFDPDIVPNGTALNLATLTFPTLYRWAAQRFPSALFTELTASHDWNQAFFLKIQQQEGGVDEVSAADKKAWNAALTALYDGDAAANEQPANLFYIMGPGDHHCVIPYSRYYTVDAGNRTPLFKVVDDLFTRGILPGNIDCRDEDGLCTQGADLRDEYELI